MKSGLLTCPTALPRCWAWGVSGISPVRLDVVETPTVAQNMGPQLQQ